MIPRERSPPFKGLDMSGMLGRRPGPKGNIVSARLNPVDALIDDDPNNDVEATLHDVADVFENPQGGSRRKLRGGGKAYDALTGLFNDASNAFATAAGVADTASAFALKNVPILLKTAAAGGTLKYALNHPSLFANIVELAKELGKTLVTVEGGATWTEYLEAGKSIGGSFVDFIATAAQQPTTPAGTILLALFIMKFRASQAGTSLKELIEADAVVLKDLAMSSVENVSTAALAQYSAFLKAYAIGSQEAAAATLGSIGRRVGAPSGEGSKQISVVAATGAPSVQSGPEGAIQAVPATKRKAFTEALEKLTRIPEKIPPKEKAAAAAAAAEADALAAMRGGRKKTQKRGPKRRITRRRKAQKILGTPVFIY